MQIGTVAKKTGVSVDAIRFYERNALVSVRSKLADLRKLENELKSALRSCDQELRNPNAHCPVLDETAKKAGGHRK
jgi:MerR family regulatory protein